MQHLPYARLCRDNAAVEYAADLFFGVFVALKLGRDLFVASIFVLGAWLLPSTHNLIVASDKQRNDGKVAGVTSARTCAQVAALEFAA